MNNIPVQDLAFYVIVGAGALCLIMALLSMGKMMRAAGFIVLAVAIALLAMWIQNKDQMFLIASAVAAVIAFLFMASVRTPLPSDMKGLSTSGR